MTPEINAGIVIAKVMVVIIVICFIFRKIDIQFLSNFQNKIFIEITDSGVVKGKMK